MTRAQAGLFSVLNQRAIVIVVLFLCLNNVLLAQSELSKINVYAEIAAVPGVEALLNFEFQIASGESVTWYGRTGFGYGGILAATGGPGVLAAISMLSGKANNHFELNGGAFIGNDTSYDDPL